MALLRPLQVIWIFDETIRPPGPKMVVCIEPDLGLFFRINTEPKWQTPVALRREPDHPFLQHDSYLECGEPLEIDDYIIEQSLERRGVIGTVSASVVPDMLAAVEKARTISQADKARIRSALRH